MLTTKKNTTETLRRFYKLQQTRKEEDEIEEEREMGKACIAATDYIYIYISSLACKRALACK